ncbi:peptide ABC transporter substrate-binding protein [Lactobacillus delbrueckii]|uniref:peptide ABC transporter substrate-binding protein n=1 Tax=Lactobacillus delbrueckii TaxID=1584 RepID=UPI0021A866D7|nr:peptide ABC transporter substrate-binding protein [Lactobacillus delbrueckii]MCT3509232.1 peptide ABC transporter substrate-binding protein [Lactobacillus delbrueckii subsp. bulgaricus]MCT3509972.1 peptide ABC transporter substrate-binding protein [Lactobacillus delbrueckii subsp. bulgaricus]MCT3512323.1 peptide ABC transporter substrate-binding protein [Lactobacillus delbrueckii subsp. bulgaricus]
MSNFKKLLTATVAVSGAGAFLLAACSKTATKSAKPVSSSGYEKSINWMTTSELESLDPAKADDTASEEQIANTYEGLYRLGENSETVPGVATKSTTSKDSLTWTFYLRKDAKWSNGDPVTAEDFVYAWRRQVDPKTASSQVNNYEGIKNAIKISEGKKKPSSLGVKAEGKYKLVVTFEKKIPYFKVVTAISLKPLDSKAVKKYGKRYGTKSAYAVYNGPFKSVGWTGSNLTWKLAKNPYYWDKKAVKLETINYSVQKTPSTDYNLYQTGKLDAAILDTQAAKSMKGKKGYRVLTLGNTTYLCYNYKKKKIFRNANLRRAISMAINRKQLLSTIGTYNTQAKTFSATNVVLDGKNFAQEAESANSSVNKYVEYDLKSARSYFKKALKELGVKKVSFTLMADDDDSYKKQTEFIQSALTEAFGGKMTVSVNNLPKTTRVSRQIANNFDVVLGGLTSDFPDPYHFLAYMQSGQTYNFGKWSNKEYDKAVKASLTMDKTKRRKALLKAEKILIDQEAISPLYHMGQAWMIRPNIKNLVFNGEYPDFKTTYAVKD